MASEGWSPGGFGMLSSSYGGLGMDSCSSVLPSISSVECSDNILPSEPRPFTHDTAPNTLPTTVRSSHRPGTHPPEQTSPFSPTYPQDGPLRSGIGVAPTPRTFTAVGTEYGDGETGFGALPPPPCPTDSRVLPYVCLASPGVHVSRHGLPRLWPWHGEAVSPDTGHGGFFQVNLVHRLVDFQLP